MNLRRQRREEPEVNLTPLIDVVFLLLIFFMVSTTFEREAKLRIELPEASAETEPVEERILEITIDIGGRYFVNDQEVVNQELATLKKAISVVLGDNMDIPVVIRADALTPHQSVVRAMDAASQLGLVKLSLATTQAASEKQ